MTEEKLKKQRAFELDFLRGFSIFLMMIMHFAFDMRYFFDFDMFAVLESDYFWVFVEPFFLCIFVGVSGICCTFSRNNFFRGLKLLGVAIAFSFVTYLGKTLIDLDCLIVFNVLHMLGVSILVYSVIQLIENKFNINPVITNVLMLFFGCYILAMGQKIGDLQGVIDGPWLLPFGIVGKNDFYMADYMALIPWLGVFLIGTVGGRVCYSDRQSLIKNPHPVVKKIAKPFEFLGKHSLIVYLVHQPVILAVIYAIVWLLNK